VYAGHYSVLKDEIITLLKPQKTTEELNIGWWVDATLGAGGHAEAALTRHPSLQLLGIDADEQMMALAKDRLAPFSSRISYYAGFFDTFFINRIDNRPIHTVLMDLGICMYHYKESGRGFSFTQHEPLDMRLRSSLVTQGEISSPTVADLLAKLSVQELQNLLQNYGNEPYSHRIAVAIVARRTQQPFLFSDDLAEFITTVTPKVWHGRNTKKGKQTYIHPATKTFQALRIAVNKELERVQNGVSMAFTQLSLNGKLGVITFHSGEDRIVKHLFSHLTKNCRCSPAQLRCNCTGPLAKFISPANGLVPSQAEVALNPASRSARFRAVQRIQLGD
jgi:16S rRNA (cytosine1402-N4)-methyltransferase